MEFIITNGAKGSMIQYWTGTGWSNQMERSAAKEYDSREQAEEVWQEANSNYPYMSGISVEIA